MNKVFCVLLLIFVFHQVSSESEYVPVDFIENVIQQAPPASPAQRIVSGWLAHPGQHPHQVALRMVYFGGQVSSCGGSVVHRNWVITAAHCTATIVTLVIRAGLTTLTRPEYIWETTEYYNHPSYDSNMPSLVQPHDISAVKVNRTFVYTEMLRPIRIQSSSDAYRDYTDEKVQASGYGRTWTSGATAEDLNWVYLRAVSHATCLATFGPSYIVSESICARFYNVTSQSICQGDSGGPLVHVGSDGVATLVGISSFVAGGDAGCHSGFPAGFVRPGPYINWLYQVTGVDFENLIEVEETTLAPTTTTTELTTTEEPTTELPTTQEPSTELPTTQEPSTELPTTQEPSTELPTTQEPSTELPTTQEPSTELPTTQEPSTELPTTQEPTTGYPITEEPTTEEVPTTQEPTTEEPASSEEDSSSSEEQELAELLKRLEVKVNVKVKLDKYKKKHSVHEIHEVKQKH